MFLRTSGNRPLTSVGRGEQDGRYNGHARTFAHCHGRYRPFNSILSLFAVLAVQVDAELVVFALSRATNAHVDELVVVVVQVERTATCTFHFESLNASGDNPVSIVSRRFTPTTIHEFYLVQMDQSTVVELPKSRNRINPN